MEDSHTHLVSVYSRRWPTSGIAFDADGTFIAANHAIEREDNLSILTADGREAKATLLGRDPSLDLAVLKAEVPLTPPTWVDPSTLKVGQLVLGIFKPDHKVRARLGLLSGLDEGFHTPGGGKVEQSITVDISTRSLSALALSDVQGRFFGFHLSGFGRGRGLSLPATTLQRVVAQLKQHGKVRRGYLGVGTQPVRIPEALKAAAQSGVGLLVTALEPGSPAEAGGLSLGDVLVAINGTPVRDVGDLWNVLGDDQVGTSITARIIRTGKLSDFTLSVGQRP